jgi:multidrug efflux pump subunit AcrA (membrane-fusion protein)
MFATYGRVEARTEAKLRTDIQAEVEQVFVQEGQWAEEGELLIQIRADEIELRLREANAEAEKEAANLRATEVEYNMLKQSTGHFNEMYRVSQQTLKRQRELAARRMIPQAMLDTALQQASRDTIEYQAHKRMLAHFPSKISQNKAALTVAQARAERAQLDLEKTKLLAPFSGPVLSVAVGPGDRTNESVVLVTMADAASFEVRASIPDQYADRVRAALANNQRIAANSAFSSAEVSTENSTKVPALELTRIAHNVRPGQSGLDAWFQYPPGTSDQVLGRVLNLTAVLPSEPGLVALPGLQQQPRLRGAQQPSAGSNGTARWRNQT